ncbi:MAG: 50S ribosomal protein L23 [Candidatus Sumerlaeaceae bacterium]|nr:50S ribosomal protein L23 [Candidatus Sumerlaeaceae bacterium]
MKSPYQILDRPIITERANILSESKKNPQYVLKVNIDANKIEIKKAIEAAYNVKVATINTVVVKGKLKRQGRYQGHRSDYKKAFVTLEKGQKLELI